MQNRRIFLAGLSSASLSGCAARGAFGTARPSDSASVQNVLVATLRKADPARHFALTGAAVLPDLDALADATRSGDGKAVLFMHGYNNSFAEGVYRHAQIAWDYGLKGPQVQFPWPSAGHPLGHVYDHDSVPIARDGLVILLLRFLGTDQPCLTVVGHSMGGFLVREALRQIAIQGDRRALDRLAAVVLMSPDIDIDVFTAQAKTVAPLPQPIVISAAQDDRLLGLSSILAGGQTRLRSLADLKHLGSLGIYVIDLTGTGGHGANHFLPGSSPTGGYAMHHRQHRAQSDWGRSASPLALRNSLRVLGKKKQRRPDLNRRGCAFQFAHRPASRAGDAVMADAARENSARFSGP
jgi:pimeloyl-ACP methyl ester carboxylesterase